MLQASGIEVSHLASAAQGRLWLAHRCLICSVSAHLSMHLVRPRLLRCGRAFSLQCSGRTALSLAGNIAARKGRAVKAAAQSHTVRRSLLCIDRTFLSTAVLQQDNGGRFRELHEAHIARLAAENKLAEVQARLASTSMSASQQARLL